jgi:hypothetical protein
MDENQESAQSTPQQQEDRTPEVGFPVAQPRPKAKSGRLVLLALALLILVGGGIFLFTRGSKEKSQETTPTPTVEGTETFPTEEPTTTPTSIDKSDIKIEVLNGTGIAGEAAYLQGVLKNLGYSDISAGNADSQDETVTTVTFARSLSSSIVDEITKKLEAIYEDVESKTSSTQKSDVVIVTGLKKGVTPKPTSTPTTTITPTATPTATTTQ